MLIISVPNRCLSNVVVLSSWRYNLETIWIHKVGIRWSCFTKYSWFPTPWWKYLWYSRYLWFKNLPAAGLVQSFRGTLLQQNTPLRLHHLSNLRSYSRVNWNCFCFHTLRFVLRYCNVWLLDSDVVILLHSVPRATSYYTHSLVVNSLNLLV